MKTAIALIIVCLPMLGEAQNKGIEFDTVATWDQIKEKARVENKYVFVDCYATWCKPCRDMDMKVYPKQAVGDFYNEKFISIKMQMDSSRNDPSFIKKRYRDAHQFRDNYKVTAYPTFFFFSPNGELVHKDIGGLSEQKLIEVGEAALNPNKQYFTLLHNYRNGQKDSLSMKLLASAAKSFGDDSLAKEVVKDYSNLLSIETKRNKDEIRFIYFIDSKLGAKYVAMYLEALSKSERFKQENLQFIREYPKIGIAKNIAKNYISKLNEDSLDSKFNGWFIQSFTETLEDRGFSLVYKNLDRINKAMNDDKWGQTWIIDPLIYNKYLSPEIGDGKGKITEPMWDKISYKIIEKYKDQVLAERLVIEGKLRWYGYKRDWSNFTKCVVEKVEKFVSKTDLWGINQNAWAIFERSNSQRELNIAVSWIEKFVNESQNEDNFFIFDTYANLLYKLGKHEEAIKNEEKAIEISSKKEGGPEGFYTKQMIA